MYASGPPIPPPKPGSHDTSRMSTPQTSQSPRPPPPPPQDGQSSAVDAYGLPPAARQPVIAPAQEIADPGDQWLPRFLEDKSYVPVPPLVHDMADLGQPRELTYRALTRKQDLAEILSTPSLLNSLTNSPQTIHPSISASQSALTAALTSNIELARHLLTQETRVAQARAQTQAQLVGAHALEHQWRLKQADMDDKLSPFAPASLYQRLGVGVGEQEAVCAALEESFLEEGGGGDGAGLASEREVLEWVRRYREAKKLYYLRQERKERWDEGRVGGWR
jgi:hypothetical protein